jgi:hypothetical protein
VNLDRVVCTSLPIVAHPVDDEGLGSWIGRVAACYSVPAQTLLKHTGIGRTNICVGNWLTLSGLHVSDILILAKTLRRSTSALTGMVTTPWCLPENAEFGMCAQCVMETFRSGRPMYWRRRWLDAVTVGCLKHVTWLTPIDANIFRKSVNWHGVEQHLLAIAENEASKQSCRTPSRLADCINMSALHLQSLFADDPDDRTAWLRYGIVSASGARRVAQDLLDILLAAEASRPDYSLLSEFASRLKIPIALHTVSIIPRQARAMRIRQVKTLEARIFAMAMTDNLMFASARINDLQLRPTAFDARSMRTHWLWPLIPPASLDLLAERIKNWPVDYVKTCWPELDNIEKASMLHRRKMLIVLCSNRDNPPTLHHRLANIRSN